LPDLPLTLEALGCNSNELTALPVLPPTLTHLWCSNNQLTALPNLPPTLEVLSCENNQLTSLPDLPPRLSRFVCTNNRFPPDLQAILDRYARNLPQLIISVNQYNADKLRRQTGRNILGLHMLRTKLPLQRYNMPQPPEVPNWLSERVMQTLTGIRTKNVARPNATNGKIRAPGNLRETLKNLKRNYNTLPRRRRRKQTKKRR
jgi:Leucine-rich repeat (LRR) protein